MDQRGPSSDDPGTVPLAYASAAPSPVYPSVRIFSRFLAVVAGVAALENASFIAGRWIQHFVAGSAFRDSALKTASPAVLMAVEGACCVLAWRMGGSIGLPLRHAQVACLVWAIAATLNALILIGWLAFTFDDYIASTGSAVILTHLASFLAGAIVRAGVPWAGYLLLRKLGRLGNSSQK